MVMSNEELMSLVEKILSPRPEIIATLVFGSRARGVSRGDSDLDVAVLLDKRIAEEDYGELRLDLTVQLQDRICIPVDVVILNNAPPLLKQQVFLKGRQLFCKSREFMTAFKTKGYFELFTYQHIADIVFETQKIRLKEALYDGRPGSGSAKGSTVAVLPGADKDLSGAGC